MSPTPSKDIVDEDIALRVTDSSQISDASEGMTEVGVNALGT